MIDGEFDYSKCSTDELIDVLRNVDSKRFPLNYANALRCLQSKTQLLAVARDESARGSGLPRAVTDAAVESSTFECGSVRDAQEEGPYSPNQIPGSQRIKLIAISLAMFAYGVHGVVVNDLYVPGKRSSGSHLHGVPALIMFGAIICTCAVMLSVVLDHYDRRDNEVNYKLFARIGIRGALALFMLSIGWDLYEKLAR